MAAIVSREGNDLIDEVRSFSTQSPHPGIEIDLGPEDLDQILLAGASALARISPLMLG
jgi:hypothetical protein